MGIDEVLEEEAIRRGRPVGGDRFVLVATDVGLIYCRPSISFAIAGRWTDITISAPSDPDDRGGCELPVTWPIHGQLNFTVHQRLASSLHDRWQEVHNPAPAANTMQAESSAGDTTGGRVVAIADQNARFERSQRSPASGSNGSTNGSNGSANGSNGSQRGFDIGATDPFEGPAKLEATTALPVIAPVSTREGEGMGEREGEGVIPMPDIPIPHIAGAWLAPEAAGEVGRQESSPVVDPPAPVARLDRRRQTTRPQARDWSDDGLRNLPPEAGPDGQARRNGRGQPGNKGESGSLVDSARPLTRRVRSSNDDEATTMTADTWRRSERWRPRTGSYTDYGFGPRRERPSGQPRGRGRPGRGQPASDAARPVAAGQPRSARTGYPKKAQGRHPDDRGSGRPADENDLPGESRFDAYDLIDFWHRNRGAIVAVALFIMAIALTVGGIRARLGADGDSVAGSTTITLPAAPSTHDDTGATGVALPADGAATVSTVPTTAASVPTTAPTITVEVTAVTSQLCHSNYSGCVPLGGDVDCVGQGAGPGFQHDPVVVLGDDVHGLDTDGDGLACEADQPAPITDD